MSLLSVIESPPLALPLAVLTGATLAWAAWNVRDTPVRTVRLTPRRAPDRDAVSRAYHAFLNGRYSDALDRAQARLDRASRRLYGRPSNRLPRTRWGAERLAPEQASTVVRMRRLYRQIAALRSVAERREAGIWLRVDFWRSREQSRTRFLGRMAPVLGDVARIPKRYTEATA